MGGFPARDWREAFAERFVAGEPDECWLWTGGVSPQGYGYLHVTPRGSVGAHVLAAEIDSRPRPHAHDVHHLCTNRLCVNTRHLEVVDRAHHRTIHAHTRKGQEQAKSDLYTFEHHLQLLSHL